LGFSASGLLSDSAEKLTAIEEDQEENRVNDEMGSITSSMSNRLQGRANRPGAESPEYLSPITVLKRMKDLRSRHLRQDFISEGSTVSIQSAAISEGWETVYDDDEERLEVASVATTREIDALSLHSLAVTNTLSELDELENGCASTNDSLLTTILELPNTAPNASKIGTVPQNQPSEVSFDDTSSVDTDSACDDKLFRQRCSLDTGPSPLKRDSNMLEI